MLAIGGRIGASTGRGLPLAVGASLAFDEGDRVAQAGDRLGIHGIRLEMWPEALHGGQLVEPCSVLGC